MRQQVILDTVFSHEIKISLETTEKNVRWMPHVFSTWFFSSQNWKIFLVDFFSNIFFFLGNFPHPVTRIDFCVHFQPHQTRYVMHHVTLFYLKNLFIFLNSVIEYKMNVEQFVLWLITYNVIEFHVHHMDLWMWCNSPFKNYKLI